MSCLLAIVIGAFQCVKAAEQDPEEIEAVLDRLAQISPDVICHPSSSFEGICIEFTGKHSGRLSDALQVLKSASLAVSIEIRCSDGLVLTESDCLAISEIQSLMRLDLNGSTIMGDGLSNLLQAWNLADLVLPKNLKQSQLDAIESWPRSLIELNVSGNALSEKSWSTLSSARALEDLDCLCHDNLSKIPDNAVGTLASFGRLIRLRINAQVDLFPRLSELKSLQVLVLVNTASNAVSVRGQDFKSLSQLTSCTLIFLSNASIEGGAMTELAKVPRLAVLELASCNIDVNEQGQFDLLSQVQVLGAVNSNIGHAAISSISRMPILAHLDLTACKIGDSEIENLVTNQNLSALRLGGTAVTDVSMRRLSQLPHLRFLEVDSTAVTDEGLAALIDAQQIEKLNLGNTKISPAGLQQLPKLLNLKYLGINGLSIDADALKALASIQTLTSLYVSNCDLDDESLRYIATTPQLSRLALTDNPRITVNGLRHIVGHPTLSELSFDSCDDSRLLRQLNQRFRVTKRISGVTEFQRHNGTIAR